MNDLLSLVPLAVVLCVGIFAQAASGFAAGLLIVTTLVWFGYPIPEAQASLIVATIPQNLWGAWKFRDAISVRQVAWPALGRLLALPVGIAALDAMELLSIQTMKQIVAGIMLAITLAICLLNPRPRHRLHWAWGWLAFPVSGFLQGLVGMGGPAMVLWVQAHDWDTRQIRGFLFMMYLISMLPALAMLYVTFGERIIEPSILAAVLTPLLLVATGLGLRAGTWLGRERLRRVTLAILILVGLVGLAAPFWEPAR
ncbi:MAG: sulfite exporter TauE/SafE family protein [Planctomycetaceae bacterium]